MLAAKTSIFREDRPRGSVLKPIKEKDLRASCPRNGRRPPIESALSFGAPRKRCDFDGESGTHSILDIFGTAEKREPFRAAPVPNDVLLATFGTTRPTHEQFMCCEESEENEAWEEFLAHLDRWEGSYFIVYARTVILS